MSVITPTATTSKTDVCPADTAEIADCADKAALKMQSQELKKQTANLNTFLTLINV